MHWTKDVSQLINPLKELSLHSDAGPIRSVLAQGAPEIVVGEYDNWNGGTTYYTLIMRVPIPTYAEIEAGVENVESQLLEKVKRFQREETHDFVTEVLIQPRSSATGRVVLASDSRHWIPGHFKLFISHLSENKVSATNLKEALKAYGISTFVAHEDIQPTKQWQDEIEKALFSMDAIAAILVPGFGRSNWTDHEIGVALGREVLVLPIMYGKNPYGLIAKYQGLKAKGKMLSEVANSVFTAIMQNQLTAIKLVTCLVEQFLLAGTEADADSRLDLLNQVETIPANHLGRIRDKFENNPSFLRSDTLLEKVNSLLGKHDSEPITRQQARARDDAVSDIPF